MYARGGAVSQALEAAHRSTARALFALCYRMMGVSADAEELVQETFVRALEARPREDEPLSGYLFRIATRLCIDRLRRRQTEGYRGPWLPSPVSDELLQWQAPAAAQYEMLESASFAFLLALEALSAEQRAALILGDVFDLSAREVGEILNLEEAHVRQLQHRARAAMKRYDSERAPRSAEHRDQARMAMMGLFAALAAGDAEGAKRWLSDDVKILSDGGGEYAAAMVPIEGPTRVAHFFSRLMELRGPPLRFEQRRVNGAWAIDAAFEVKRPREAPRSITFVELDASGRIALIYSVVASRKLAAPNSYR